MTLLMDTVVSPEHPIRIDPPEHPVDEKVIQSSIKTFELRDGPADVTSYHDFNSLQIAFRHVWTEVFDTELEALGKELYQEFVKLKDFSGLDNGKDDPISTVEDLARLIADVKELSKLTQGELPGGSGGGRNGTGLDAPAGRSDLRDDPLYQALTGSLSTTTPRRRCSTRSASASTSSPTSSPARSRSPGRSSRTDASPAASTRSRRRSRRTP